MRNSLKQIQEACNHRDYELVCDLLEKLRINLVREGVIQDAKERISAGFMDQAAKLDAAFNKLLDDEERGAAMADESHDGIFG
jgi:hypothetical protein